MAKETNINQILWCPKTLKWQFGAYSGVIPWTYPDNRTLAGLTSELASDQFFIQVLATALGLPSNQLSLIRTRSYILSSMITDSCKMDMENAYPCVKGKYYINVTNDLVISIEGSSEPDIWRLASDYPFIESIVAMCRSEDAKIDRFIAEMSSEIKQKRHRRSSPKK